MSQKELQAKAVQRQDEEEEVQAKAVQRQEVEPEEELALKAVQRQEEGSVLALPVVEPVLAAGSQVEQRVGGHVARVQRLLCNKQ